MLNTTDPKENRESYKNEAIQTREAGKLEEAAEMFNEAIAWDQENENTKGEMDVMGHLRITYSLLAKQQENEDEKRHYLELAMDTAESIMEIGRSVLGLEKEQMAVALAHSVDARMEFSPYLEKNAAQEMLRLALEDAEISIENLPGAEAHKSWVLQKKAQIQYLMGDPEEALNTLSLAENMLYKGYKQELDGGDQAEMKLNVWLSGIFLTKAYIYSKENRPILAKHYANAVLSIEDKDDYLVNRKQEAQRILNTV